MAKKVAKKAESKTTKKKAPVLAPPPPVDPTGVPLVTAPDTPVESPSFVRADQRSHAEKMRIVNKMRQANPTLFVSADELSSPYLLRRPTGVIELDIALGGGFPAGGSSMLSGPYNSGKSWLLWKMFAMQQRIFGNEFIGAIAHPEGALDYEYIRRCGCYISVPDEVINGWNEIRRQRRLPELTSQEVDFWKLQIGHLETIQGDTGEEILKGVLQLHKNNICNIISIDSLNSLQSYVDADKDMDESAKRAAHANMMKEFWLRYVPHLRRGYNQTTTMMVQQVVSNQQKANMPAPMQRYIPDWEVKGGEASKHYKLIDLVVWSGEKIRDSNKNIIGKTVNFKTLKGKAGTHDNISGEFQYYYHLNGPDMVGDLIASGLRRGVIIQYSSKLYVVNAQTHTPIDDTSYNSDKELRERLNSDSAFEFALRREILASAGCQCLYR